MRAHILIAVIAITMPWTTQAEQSLTADGYLAQPGSVDAPAANGDRVGLINDGSFEFGECENGSAWTCTTNTDCSWIINPSGLWGYPAYDGILCAWLGGFCGSEFNLNTFCQEILFDGMYLDWYWMGYNSGHFTLSIDGVQVFGWVCPATPMGNGIWPAKRGLMESQESMYPPGAANPRCSASKISEAPMPAY